MLKTKFLLFISILLLTFSFNSFAQTDSSKIDLEGKWALQFGISRNFTLNSFQGATFSGKYHFTNNSALRIGITVFGHSTKSNNNKNNYNADTLYSSSKEESTVNDNWISIQFQYLYYAKMTNSISAYFGAGVQSSRRFVSQYSNTEEIYMSDENFSYRSKELSAYGLGADILIGVEWFVRSNIGILAEYSSGFNYEHRESEAPKNKNDAEYYYENKSDTYSFSPHGVKFGVSIYF